MPNTTWSACAGLMSPIGGGIMAGSFDYILGGTLTEQERLVKQCESFAPEARCLVDR